MFYIDVARFNCTLLAYVLLIRYGFTEPDRGNLHNPTIRWREGKPDYTLANLTYVKGKCQNHAKGALYRQEHRIRPTVQNKVWYLYLYHLQW